MAIKINFDLANNPEAPTLILATRDGNKLGQIEAKEIELSDKLIGASEITFIVNKYVDGRLTNLWDKIVDFKLVHCQEWDIWFEIRVEIDEDTKTVKTVFGTQLAQAELSQLMLYNIEINTEADIARDDYEISVLYDEDHPEASILHRLFEKAPHYRFGNIDGTIAKMQRSFSFDEISIYDALQEIGEEIGCLFIFHSGTDVVTGEIERYISVHDLEQCCGNVPDCGYRGEFTEVCPKCGSTNIIQGYGEDTTIFVTADELASNNIQFTTDTDSVKNCFKLEAGDDLMTATIRNCNPNGTDYIWYFSDSVKQDMSQALRDKLAAYDAMYQDYQVNYSANLDSALVNRYNSLVNKYKPNNSQLENIDTSVKGYSNLMNAYYNVVDLSLYLESGMMPTVSMSGTTAAQEAAKLTASSLSPLAVTKLQYASRETVNSVALGMAKVLIKPTYKVEINGTSVLSDYVEGATTRTWRGSFTVTNYSDEEDTFTTGSISVTVNDNAEYFTKQKIEKALNKEDTEDYSVVGVFKKSIHALDIGIVDCNCAFCEELRKYALKPLVSFRDACQACIDILIEQGATKDSLYNSLYLPYWLRLKAIEKEIKIRENEISDIDGIYDDEGNLIKKGLASEIEKVKAEIQEHLDFEKFLHTDANGNQDDDLWREFCSYRREDKYKNENYISDGLNNAELFTRALEFIDVAENEIYKSSELQHSISSTLKNLMVVEKFKPFVDYFEVGNWMRVQLDDSVYKLRLLEYTIDFDNIGDIAVVFSDVSKVRNGLSDLEDLFSQASSMTSHYDAVLKQASKGQAAQGTIEQWLQDGLNSALVQINNNNSEEVTITENGILCRSYDASTDSYSLEQLKLTHNILAYTNDDWQTVRQAIGKHLYKMYDDNPDSSTYDRWIDDVGYGISADFVTSGYLTGATIVGGNIYSANYSNGTGGSTTPMGTYINLETGEFSFGGEKIVYDKDSDTITLKNVTITWNDGSGSGGVNPPSASDIDGLDAFLNQLDGKISTYKQANDPSTGWTSEEKSNHIGDLWFDTNTGITKRWNGSSWDIITDKELEELAQSKAQIFTSTPTPPYNVGDLWVQGATGDIYHCITARASGNYVSNDWVKSSKYTDDSALTTFINDTYKTNLEAIQQQMDKKAETWCQPNDPSTSWNTDALKNEHVGDLWQDTDDGNREWIYVKINNANGTITYKWEESTVDIPDEVFDAIDKKAAIYVSQPSSQNVGDLLIPVNTFSHTYNGTTYTFTAKKIYRCTTDANSFIPSYWVEVAYTDDSTALAAQSVANEAKTIADTLSTGIGFKTEIGGNYIISPVVGTCTLLIGDESGVYSKIDSQGNFTSNSATIIGAIKSGGRQYTKNGSLYYGYNFNAEGGLNGTIKMGLKSDGTYSMTVNSDGTINFSDDVILSFGGGGSGDNTPVTPPATGGTTTNEDTDLRNALGWTGTQSTQISGRYVISPHIQGGYLFIGNATNYAEIKNGVLTAQGAQLIGSVSVGASSMGGYNFIADNTSVRACHLSGSNYNFVINNNGTLGIGRNSNGTYNFQVDSSGNVTVRGTFTVLGGSTDSGNAGGGSGGTGLTSTDVTTIIGNTVTTGFVDALNVTAKYVTAGYIKSSNYAGGTSFNSTSTVGSFIDLSNGKTNLGGKLIYDGSSLTVKGAIEATSLMIGSGTSQKTVDNYISDNIDSTVIRQGTAVTGNTASVTPPTDYSSKSGYFYVDTRGNLFAKSGMIGGWTIRNVGLRDSTGVYGLSIRQSSDDEVFINSYGSSFKVLHSGLISMCTGVQCYDGGVTIATSGYGVSTYNLTVKQGGTIKISDISNHSESNVKDTFKIERDVYFTRQQGLRDYTSGRNIMRIDYGDDNTLDLIIGDDVAETFEYVSIHAQEEVRVNGTMVHNSDAKLKEDICIFDDGYEKFFNNLNPVSYRFINNPSRKHFGFIAQDIRDNLINLTSNDDKYAILSSMKNAEGEETLGLAYTEFIALNTHMIQKCLKEIDNLKSENESLKQQLQEIKQSI